jgi:preprotein translocase SecE subunit
MASKALANSDNDPFKKPQVFNGLTSKWGEFTGFLSDVRGEMRKVVSPSWKEVRVTTSVVIAAVFFFGLFFLIVDNVFRVAVYGLLGKLGGLQ